MTALAPDYLYVSQYQSYDAWITKLEDYCEEVILFWEKPDPERFIKLYGVNQGEQGTFTVSSNLVHHPQLSLDRSLTCLLTRAEAFKRQLIKEHMKKFKRASTGALNEKDWQYLLDLESRPAISFHQALTGPEQLPATFASPSIKAYIDKNVILESSQYFGYHLPNDPKVQVLNSRPNPFTRLPVELQLAILDRLSLYEADKVIRHSYPHLIVRWCLALPQKMKTWFSALCSPNNMRFVGAGGISRSHNIYRLRSIDLHPTLRMKTGQGAVPPGWRSKPPAALHHDPVAWSLATVFWSLTCQNYSRQPTPVIGVGGRSNTKRQPQPCPKCPSGHKELENPPFLISLMNFSDMSPWTWRNKSPNDMFLYRQRELREEFPKLLIYADELQIVMKSLEIMLRPIFLTSPSKEVPLIPKRLGLSMMMRGVAALHLMEEDSELNEDRRNHHKGCERNDYYTR